MDNPVIAQLTRGDRVESIHRGRFALVDADGTTVLSCGDIEAPVYPRSAMKLIQALVMVEARADESLDLDTRMLALATSSHSSEPDHVALVDAMLARVGLSDADLGCGPHWPWFSQAEAGRMGLRGQTPRRAHNQCSGKHAGMLCACHALGHETQGYLGHAHPVQREIRAVLEDVTASGIVADGHGIDGCSAPTYAVPLKALAHGFARLATGSGLGPARAAAGNRLMRAAMAEPWYVAGTDRWCTQVMQAGDGRIYAKTGAEGIYCAAVPDLGLGITIKCDDGNARAADVLLGAILSRLFDADAQLAGVMAGFSEKPVMSFAGEKAGVVRAAMQGW